MADLNKLATDLGRARDGVWFTYYKDPGGEDIEFKLGSIQNPEYKNYVRGELLSRRSRFGDSEPSSDEMNRILAVGMSQFICRDWRGLRLGDELVKHSVEKCREILTNPKLGDVLDFMVEKSGARAEFLAEVAEDSAKNSKPASDG